MPGQVSTFALACNPAPDLVDVFLQFGVFDQRCGAKQIAGDFAAELDFFFLGWLFEIKGWLVFAFDIAGFSAGSRRTIVRWFVFAGLA
jgi:hypothetical protein